jgi:hypothetical protein
MISTAYAEDYIVDIPYGAFNPELNTDLVDLAG